MVSPDAHEHSHSHDHGHEHVPDHEYGPEHEHDASCAVAHGTVPVPASDKVLVAVFASPVAGFLLRYASDAGYRAVLIEPDPGLAAAASADGTELAHSMDGFAPGSADVVVTDHHRDELGVQLRDALAAKARWVGIMGNPRHEGPHVQALADLGVASTEIVRVHRPIGLNIGSRAPAEIAIATLAGLIADRNGKPGGFTF
jgi:xanthine/CO dehydrogenase XdhC/CoxF family maturation factor